MRRNRAIKKRMFCKNPTSTLRRTWYTVILRKTVKIPKALWFEPQTECINARSIIDANRVIVINEKGKAISTNISRFTL